MTAHEITLSLNECRKILVRNWDLLSDKTKDQLQALGINPSFNGKANQPANNRSQNSNI